MPTLIKEIKGYSDGLLSVAFSPSGAFFAVGGEDNKIHLHSFPSGDLRKSFDAHEGDVKCVAFSPDGSKLASAGWDGMVKIWDSASCLALQEIKEHKGPVNSLAWSADGALLVTGSDDATAKIFDTGRFSLVRTLDTGSGDVKAVAVSPDCRVVATGGVALKIWDAATGKLLGGKDDYIHGIRALAFSPDGALVIGAAGMGKRLEVCRLAEFSFASVKDTDWLNSVCFAADGRLLTGGGSAAKIWPAPYSAPAISLEGHSDEIYSAAFSPDGKAAVTASNDKTVRLWSLQP
jgi:WD40 repeat protein